ncbi:MAG: integration host factor, alpha subunit [Bacteriovoracaceae bacterium]|nr:integration host factor, alpha subunit [Bacteriovoracaceae bacterium]
MNSEGDFMTEGDQKQTLTKADIVDQVFEKVGLTKKDATEIVEFVFDTLKDTLKTGDKVKISGFGNFIVRKKRSRVGRNPQTKEEMTISARRVLTFKPSQVLRAMLNRDFSARINKDTEKKVS